MRIGYGFKRTEEDFAGLDVAAVFLDSEGSNRHQRTALFESGLQAGRGDTLVMLAKGDLGYGRELQRLRLTLDSMGATVVYAEKHPASRKKMGRPGYSPTPVHDKQIRRAWHDDGRTIIGVIRIAADLGYIVREHQLKYRYGARFKEHR